jgi:hypothetical protein
MKKPRTGLSSVAVGIVLAGVAAPATAADQSSRAAVGPASSASSFFKRSLSA